MGYRVLANAYVKREHFKEESVYSKDDFFILAVEGAFSVERDGFRFTVSPGEGAFLLYFPPLYDKFHRPERIYSEHGG